MAETSKSVAARWMRLGSAYLFARAGKRIRDGSQRRQAKPWAPAALHRNDVFPAETTSQESVVKPGICSRSGSFKAAVLCYARERATKPCTGQKGLHSCCQYGSIYPA
jgi:hypothetical protein